MNKYAIIGGEIHKLVRMPKGKDWTAYAWRIKEKGEWYWVPIPDEKREPFKLDPNKRYLLRRSF